MSDWKILMGVGDGVVRTFEDVERCRGGSVGLLDYFHHLGNECNLLSSHYASALVVLVFCLDPVCDGGERSCEIHKRMLRAPSLLGNSSASGVVQDVEAVRDFVDAGCCCRYNAVLLWV